MRNLIYQVYGGKMGGPEKHSSRLLTEYAVRIGAEYRLDIDKPVASKTCDVEYYFEWLNFMLDDTFLEYDNLLIIDMDIYPVDNLTKDIFKDFIETGKEFGVCTEPFQGKMRKSVTVGGGINAENDEKWNKVVAKRYGKQMPRDANGDLIAYNAGMVLVSKAGVLKARNKFEKFQTYISAMRNAGLPRFYTVDQNYFHCQMVIHGDYAELDNGWNGYIHYVRGPLGEITPIHDGRTDKPKFVHIQLSGGSNYNNDKIDRITNLQIDGWLL